MSNHADSNQPMPTGNGSPVLVELLSDLIERRKVGVEKYKTELKTENGRDPLVDAYQEALDLAMYLKQRLMEQRTREPAVTPTHKREAHIIAIALGRWLSGTLRIDFDVPTLVVQTSPEELEQIAVKFAKFAGFNLRADTTPR